MSENPPADAHVLWHNTSEVVTPDASGSRIERVPKGAVVFSRAKVVAVGPEADLLRRYAHARLVDIGGRLVTPGLVDCHTHLLFAGQRADEYQRRLAGESYAAIAASGGGIRATVRATQVATDAELERRLLERLRHWRAGGVTTVEIKSGYGLTPEAELRLLGILAQAPRSPVHVERTALLLHALPDEWKDRRADYVEQMCGLLPAIRSRHLASAVDAYCDRVAFTADECRGLLVKAREQGFAVRLHAEQLERTGGASLAAELPALSADHLECALDEDWRALARAGVVGVLLPVAALTLGQRLPQASSVRQAGARIAVATDFNPGTSPAQSLVECASLAARLSGLTAEESLLAVTWNAAQALGLAAERGHLTPGACADLVAWDCSALEELTYWLPAVRAERVVVGGLAAPAPTPQEN